MGHQANTSVNYQELALEFKPGDTAYPFPGDRAQGGRVVEVFPAIGMIELATPAGTVRVPVEELMRSDGDDPVPPKADNIPGGKGVVPVDGGPSVVRVARAFVEASLAKNALYWAEADRKYRASQSEQDSHTYFCPKCKDTRLKSAVYRRENGSSLRLLGCPTCMFLVEKAAILNHPETVAEVA